MDQLNYINSLFDPHSPDDAVCILKVINFKAVNLKERLHISDFLKQRCDDVDRVVSLITGHDLNTTIQLRLIRQYILEITDYNEKEVKSKCSTTPTTQTLQQTFAQNIGNDIQYLNLTPESPNREIENSGFTSNLSQQVQPVTPEVIMTDAQLPNIDAYPLPTSFIQNGQISEIAPPLLSQTQRRLHNPKIDEPNPTGPSIEKQTIPSEINYQRNNNWTIGGILTANLPGNNIQQGISYAQSEAKKLKGVISYSSLFYKGNNWFFVIFESSEKLAQAIQTTNARNKEIFKLISFHDEKKTILRKLRANLTLLTPRENKPTDKSITQEPPTNGSKKNPPVKWDTNTTLSESSKPNTNNIPIKLNARNSISTTPLSQNNTTNFSHHKQKLKTEPLHTDKTEILPTIINSKVTGTNNTKLGKRPAMEKGKNKQIITSDDNNESIIHNRVKESMDLTLDNDSDTSMDYTSEQLYTTYSPTQTNVKYNRNSRNLKSPLSRNKTKELKIINLPRDLLKKDIITDLQTTEQFKVLNVNDPYLTFNQQKHRNFRHTTFTTTTLDANRALRNGFVTLRGKRYKVTDFETNKSNHNNHIKNHYTSPLSETDDLGYSTSAHRNNKLPQDVSSNTILNYLQQMEERYNRMEQIVLSSQITTSKRAYRRVGPPRS
jgi:hypothetical protein